MRRALALVLIASLVALQLSAVHCQDEELEIEDAEDVEEEKAFLVTRKSVAGAELVVGRNTTVQIEIHNAGTSSALDVEVEDIAWPAQQFEHTGGASSAKYPRLVREAHSTYRITAGSTAKFSYYITPLSAGFYIARPAVVSYRDMPDATKRQVLRSSTPHLYILTNTQRYIKTAITVGSYVSLGSMRSVAEWRNVGVVLALGVIAIVGQRSYKSFAEARKRGQYQRALEEVNKMK